MSSAGEKRGAPDRGLRRRDELRVELHQRDVVGHPLLVHDHERDDGILFLALEGARRVGDRRHAPHPHELADFHGKFGSEAARGQCLVRDVGGQRPNRSRASSSRWPRRIGREAALARGRGRRGRPRQSTGPAIKGAIVWRRLRMPPPCSARPARPSGPFRKRGRRPRFHGAGCGACRARFASPPSEGPSPLGSDDCWPGTSHRRARAIAAWKSVDAISASGSGRSRRGTGGARPPLP